METKHVTRNKLLLVLRLFSFVHEFETGGDVEAGGHDPEFGPRSGHNGRVDCRPQELTGGHVRRVVERAAERGVAVRHTARSQVTPHALL